MSVVNELIDEIIGKRKQALDAKITRYPRNNPILSDIGECNRQIEYGVTHWQERAMFNDYVQARLDVGNATEKRIVRELSELGFDILLSQQPVKILGRAGETLATGKIDGFIKFKGKKIPLEIKSMNPMIFNQIRTIDDLRKKPWLRKYLRQLEMYLYGNDCEEGFFLIDDCLGHWKMITVQLSYESCEYILQRLERIHANLKNSVQSERIPYEEKICGQCPFLATCLPDVQHTGMEILNSPEFEGKLRRRAVLEPMKNEFEDLDEEIKDVAKAHGKDILAGDFSLFLRESERTSYDVPDEIKKPFMVKKKFYTVKIVSNTKTQQAEPAATERAA